ncbi:uncharacterized protein LOC126884207 [Diabrotica virgifera virgifera]|uniref:HAT C-terminal dimerisation domain-containing protein n=1 Tax=Diabrotica virgifera virgifera TaxID=50390 RepID=A0ABM5K775_DIAVI|nr:uncharacterized protein LOC126880539 [Diabrotica virgifera virgifera]XP_050506041.1 uncharacterized protein LOC126884207 [Diabrotica virgifera virgifera]
MNTFVSRKGSPGMFYAQAETAVNNRSFMGIELYVKSKEGPINAVVFYDHLAQSIEKRVLSGDDAVLANCARIVDKSAWLKNIKDNTFGERDIEALAVRLQVNKREAIKSFREYVFDNCRNLGENCENNSYPENLLRLTTALKTIPISSSECERGFSQMNLIITDDRVSLLTKTVSSLMFVKLNGPPLTRFEPSKYVNSWLLRGRHSALDTNSTERAEKRLMTKSSPNFGQFYKLQVIKFIAFFLVKCSYDLKTYTD